MKFKNILLIIFAAILAAALSLCVCAQGSVNSNNDAPAETNNGYPQTSGVFGSDGESSAPDDPATEYNESDEISTDIYGSDSVSDTETERITALDPATNTSALQSGMAGGGAMTAVLAVTAAVAGALLLIFGFAANRRRETDH